MDLIIEQVDVWAATIEDKPGGVAAKLTSLAQEGADLDFIVARRSPEKPGKGVVFVTPLRGDREVEAATQVGFSATQSLHSLRVEGTNEAGIGATVTRKLGEAGVNLRGLSAAVLGTRFIMYLAFDSSDDAARAAGILETL